MRASRISCVDLRDLCGSGLAIGGSENKAAKLSAADANVLEAHGAETDRVEQILGVHD
jgi:hypothetical protein